MMADHSPDELPRSAKSLQCSQRMVFSARSAWAAVYVAAVGLLLSAVLHADGEKIAVFTKNQTNPYFQMLRLGADNAAKQMNARVTHYVPTRPDSIPDQMSQIEDVITKRPDAVVFVPVDFKAMAPGLLKMNGARIPVVNVTDRVEKGEIVTFVGLDDYSVGLETARYLFKKMNGTGGIIILEGVRGVLTSSERLRGFKKALAEFPTVKLLASQPANYQRLAALTVTENLLQSHPNINGVLAANDSMALGALEAFEGANRKVLAVGINGTKEAMDAIKAGRLLASGDNNGFVQGCIGTMAAIRQLRKLPVPKDVVFPATIIDSTNYKAYDILDSQRSCPKWESVVK
jgi:ribose transport system substrate-binding protein